MKTIKKKPKGPALKTPNWTSLFFFSLIFSLTLPKARAFTNCAGLASSISKQELIDPSQFSVLEKVEERNFYDEVEFRKGFAEFVESQTKIFLREKDNPNPVILQEHAKKLKTELYEHYLELKKLKLKSPIRFRYFVESYLAKFRFDKASLSEMAQNSKIFAEYYRETVGREEYKALLENSYTNSFAAESSPDYLHNLFFREHLPMIIHRGAVEIISKLKVLERLSELSKRLRSGPITLKDGTILTSALPKAATHAGISSSPAMSDFFADMKIAVKITLPDGMDTTVFMGKGKLVIPWGPENSFVYDYQTGLEKLAEVEEMVVREQFKSDERELEKQLQQLRARQMPQSPLEKIRDRFEVTREDLKTLARFAQILDEVFNDGRDRFRIDQYLKRIDAHLNMLIGMFFTRIQVVERFQKVVEAIEHNPKLSRMELGRAWFKIADKMTYENSDGKSEILVNSKGPLLIISPSGNSTLYAVSIIDLKKGKLTIFGFMGGDSDRVFSFWPNDNVISIAQNPQLILSFLNKLEWAESEIDRLRPL